MTTEIVKESGKTSRSNPLVTPAAVVAPVPVMVPVNHAKKPRFDGKCFVCDKQGHKAADCRSRRGNQNKEPAQANMTEMELEALSDGVEEKLNLSA